MNTEELKAAVNAACLAAAISLGDEIKELSWFGANHPSPTSKLAQAT